MAFTVTAQHTGTSGATAVQSQATNSTAPTANSLLLAFACVERDVHTVAESWSFTGGGTWNAVAATASFPWTGTPDFNVAAALRSLAVGASPTGHTITADAWSGVEDGYYSVIAADITGHNAASPIAQFKVGGATEGGGDGESLAITFDNALITGNLVVANFGAGNDVAGAFTAPTIGGQTMLQLHNLTDNFCHAGMWYRVINGAETDRTVTCSDLGQSVGASAAILVEIKAASTDINGSGTATASPAQVAGTVTVTVTGTGSATAPAATVAGTGSVGEPPVTGSGDLTAPAAVAAGAATILVTASGSLTAPDATATGTGAVIVTGSGSAVAPATIASGYESAYRYVTDVSANGRYFVDQNADPILIRGESPWLMFTALSLSEMETYLENRASYGCNLALVSMIGSAIGGGAANGATFDGVLPFTGGDPTVFNETYWARMDACIAKARDVGIVLMIYPMDGWNTQFASVVFNPGSISNSQCQTYGQTLAARYLSYPNIVWSFGGDYDENATVNDRFNACLTGIRAAGDTRPASIQLLYETSESHNSTFWETRVDYNWVYTYYVTYKGTSDAYNHTFTTSPTTRPALFAEGAYENSFSPHDGTDEALRRQACWALTSGSPGEMTGQEGVWDFQSGWASLLDTTAADQIKAIRDAVEPLEWWTLVPDDANTLVTAGRGTRVTTDSITFPVDNNYVTAARNTDKTLALIYMPNAASAITVNMAQMGGNPTATWVDPTTGTTFTDTPDGSYSRGNNAAADTDWLLILTGDPVTVTGSGTAVAPAATSSGTGTVTVTGTGSATAPNGVTAGTGGVVVSGTGQATATPASVSGTGTVAISATGSVTAPAGTASGSGGVVVAGTGNATAPAAVAAGTGTIGAAPVTGTGDLTAPLAVASGTGSVGVAGSGSTVAPAAQVTGSGTVTVVAAGGVSAPLATVSGTGGVRVTGSGTATAPAATVAGSGNIGSAPITGTGNAVAPAATVTGTGTLGPAPINGTGTAVAPAASATGSGTVLVDGNGSIVTPNAIITGTGAVVITATGSAIAPAAVVTGSMNAKLTYRPNEGRTPRL